MANNSGNLLRWFIVAAGISFISFSFYAYQIFFTANVNVDKKATYLYIPTGAKFETVVDSLNKHDLLYDKLSFLFLSKLLKYRDNIKPGRYLIDSSASNLNIIQKLKNGYQAPVTLTFNNVRLKQDLARKLGKSLESSEADFLAALKDTAEARAYGFDTTTILVMFIPNSYEVYWNISVKSLLDKMHKEYTKFWTEDRLTKASEGGLSPIQVSILASIVEAETNNKTERPTVAGVYLNRLKKNMPLQADPTVKFALGDFSIKRIYEGYTKIESPYNTYKNTGLPPGPIDLPSINSIDAVLNAEQHNYIYFCASDELNGKHNFAATYTEHLKNANKYQDALDKRKIR